MSMHIFYQNIFYILLLLIWIASQESPQMTTFHLSVN